VGWQGIVWFWLKPNTIWSLQLFYLSIITLSLRTWHQTEMKTTATSVSTSSKSGWSYVNPVEQCFRKQKMNRAQTRFRIQKQWAILYMKCAVTLWRYTLCTRSLTLSDADIDNCTDTTTHTMVIHMWICALQS
jgi:hypothetical protein